MIVKNQNCIPEEIKSRLNMENACYRSSQEYFFVFLSPLKKLNYNYNLTIILPILHGYKTWSLTLREEHRLRVFENRVLRRIFGPKREEVAGG
jgi:hypothetical protein